MRTVLRSLVFLAFPILAVAATVEEAREIVRAASSTFSWTVRPETLALLMDADARVAFHKIVEGRPLRATDPEWRKHYAGFQKDYTESVLKALQPLAWSSPEFDRRFAETLAKELSSAEAKTVLAFLESDEVKAMMNDPLFQTTWPRLITFVPRFQEHELGVLLSPDELKELTAAGDGLMKKYPHGFQTLSPFPYSKRDPAVSRFVRLWGQRGMPAASPGNDTAPRLNAAIQQVIEKWKPIVAGRASLPAPRFEDYSAPLSYVGSPARVALKSHPRASTWRTQLRTGSREGPNFADHYTVVTWGCGTDCMQIALVDARDGKVFFPENLGALSFVNIDEAEFDAGVLRFRRDSRLLVAVGMPNEDAKQRGVSYYEWTGSDLRLIRRVSLKAQS